MAEQRAQLGSASAPAWNAMQRQLRVQVFGAETAVGRELTVELLSAGHPMQGLGLFGSQPRILGWQGQRLEIRVPGEVLPEADIAFLCMSREQTQPLTCQLGSMGTRMVDLSGACKADPGTPLFSGRPHADQLGAFTPVVTLPNRSAVGLAAALGCVERSAGLAELSVVAMLAAASEGSRGILGLRDELAAWGTDAGQALGQRRVGNLRPALGEQVGDTGGWLEQELRSDLLRMLGRPELGLDILALEGAHERSDAFVVQARLRAALSLEIVASAFAGHPGIVLHQTPLGPHLIHISAPTRPQRTSYAVL